MHERSGVASKDFRKGHGVTIVWRSIVMLSFMLAGIAGCVCAETKTDQDVAQVIIKFKNANTEPASASVLKSLGETTKLKVRHLRPMTGGAQIYVLSGAYDEALLSQAIKQVSARPDVEYCELDRKLKPQKDRSNGNR
jgi:hypothetical protein